MAPGAHPEIIVPPPGNVSGREYLEALKKWALETARICANCGTCLSECPVYRQELQESAGPRGKAQLACRFLEDRLGPSPLLEKIIGQCLLCGKCEQACPKGVPFLEMMLACRQLLAAGSARPSLKKAILGLYGRPLFMKAAPAVLSLARCTPWRSSLPKPARSQVERGLFTRRPEPCDILLFPGCVLGRLFPDRLLELKKALEKSGYRVAVPAAAAGCGFPHLSQGRLKRFLELRAHNRRVFAAFQPGSIVVPCGSGFRAIADYYDLEGIPCFEFSDFYSRQAGSAGLKIPAGRGKLTYHLPCHQPRDDRGQVAVMPLLRELGPGFVEAEKNDCCGFGGFFSFSHPSMAAAFREKRCAGLLSGGAESVVTTCPGCYLHLQPVLGEKLLFFSEITV